MASMNMVEQLEEEQPSAKKPRIEIDNSKEQMEVANSNASDLPKSMEQKDEVTETSTTTTTVDLPRPHRKLPAELDREIYLCLNPATQRKFIYGLGWDFYAMFRYKLLKKTKRLCNPSGNRWEGNKGRGKVTFSRGGLNANNITRGWMNVWAAKGFAISGPNCREDDFPGTVLYYFEIKILTPTVCWSPVGPVGLTTDIDISDRRWIGDFANSYATSPGYYEYRLANGDYQDFEFPQGAIRPVKKGYMDVYGCGLVMDPDKKLAIFFTLNGQFLGRQIPICSSVDRLFPALTIWDDVYSVEANFGDDNSKPFLYDIKNCPGMDLPCF